MGTLPVLRSVAEMSARAEPVRESLKQPLMRIDRESFAKIAATALSQRRGFEEKGRRTQNDFTNWKP